MTRRKLRLLAVLALLLLCLAVGVGTWRERLGLEGSTARSERVSPQQDLVAITAVSPTAASLQASLAASAAGPVQAASAATPPAVWDLCGIGRLPVPPGSAASVPADPFDNLPPHLGADAFERGLQALMFRLDQGPARWRAAAILLRGTGAAGEPYTLAMSRLASSSSDPVVAMWALQRCGVPNPCAHADLQRWLSLDPDNLLPWMAALDRYPEQRQATAERLAQATRFDQHEHALTGTVLEALQPNFPPHLHQQLWTHVIGVEAAISTVGLGAVAKSCPQGLKPGTDQFLWCAKVAKTMVETSTSFLGLLVGLRLAERTYMPAKEAATRRAEYNKLSLLPLQELHFEQPMSCTAGEQIRSWVQRGATLGEVQAHRALAAAQAAASAPR